MFVSYSRVSEESYTQARYPRQPIVYRSRTNTWTPCTTESSSAPSPSSDLHSPSATTYPRSMYTPEDGQQSRRRHCIEYRRPTAISETFPDERYTRDICGTSTSYPKDTSYRDSNSRDHSGYSGVDDSHYNKNDQCSGGGGYYGYFSVDGNFYIDHEERSESGSHECDGYHRYGSVSATDSHSNESSAYGHDGYYASYSGRRQIPYRRRNSRRSRDQSPDIDIHQKF